MHQHRVVYSPVYHILHDRDRAQFDLSTIPPRLLWRRPRIIASTLDDRHLARRRTGQAYFAHFDSCVWRFLLEK